MMAVTFAAQLAPECQQRIYCVRNRLIVDAVYTQKLPPLNFKIANYHLNQGKLTAEL